MKEVSPKQDIGYNISYKIDVNPATMNQSLPLDISSKLQEILLSLQLDIHNNSIKHSNEILLLKDIISARDRHIQLLQNKLMQYEAKEQQLNRQHPQKIARKILLTKKSSKNISEFNSQPLSNETSILSVKNFNIDSTQSLYDSSKPTSKSIKKTPSKPSEESSKKHAKLSVKKIPLRNSIKVKQISRSSCKKQKSNEAVLKTASKGRQSSNTKSKVEKKGIYNLIRANCSHQIKAGKQWTPCN